MLFALSASCPEPVCQTHEPVDSFSIDVQALYAIQLGYLVFLFLFLKLIVLVNWPVVKEPELLHAAAIIFFRISLIAARFILSKTATLLQDLFGVKVFLGSSQGFWWRLVLVSSFNPLEEEQQKRTVADHALPDQDLLVVYLQDSELTSESVSVQVKSWRQSGNLLIRSHCNMSSLIFF